LAGLINALASTLVNLLISPSIDGARRSFLRRVFLVLAVVFSGFVFGYAVLRPPTHLTEALSGLEDTTASELSMMAFTVGLAAPTVETLLLAACLRVGMLFHLQKRASCFAVAVVFGTLHINSELGVLSAASGVLWAILFYTFLQILIWLGGTWVSTKLTWPQQACTSSPTPWPCLSYSWRSRECRTDFARIR
jgi:hypothetical protein